MTDSTKGVLTKDIDAYLASVTSENRVALEELRKIIHDAAPDAIEGISYRIPVFKWHGPLVFFAAFTNHLGLYVVDKTLLEQFKHELAPFKVSGTTIHFSPEHPLPASLVTRIVRARMEGNLARATPVQVHSQQYVAFFRGINVGGHHPITMNDLKSAFVTHGFQKVQTVLTSGNVIFASEQKDISQITRTIADLFQSTFSQQGPVIVRTIDDLHQMYVSDPFKGIAKNPDFRFYVTFLKEPVNPVSGEQSSVSFPKGILDIRLSEREVFSIIDLNQGKGTSGLMVQLEKMFGSDITTRNWNTIEKILSKAKK